MTESASAILTRLITLPVTSMLRPSCATRQIGRPVIAAALMGILLAASGSALAADNDLAARVDRVLAATPLIDGHNDLPWELRIERRATRGDRSAVGHSETSRARRRRTADDGHSASARRSRRRAVLVGLGADGIQRTDAVKTTLEQIDLVKRMVAAYPTDLQMAYTAADIVASTAGKDRFADRHRGRPLDQQLARDAAADVCPWRALHDADAHPEQRLGGLGDGQAHAPWPDAFRPGRGPRNEPSGHAGRPESCLGGDDEGRACRHRGAGDLLPFRGAGGRHHPRNVPDDVLRWSRRTAAWSW